MNNHWKSPSDGVWRRTISLDRICEDQRHEQIWQKNPKYHGRKISVSSIYRWHVNCGWDSAAAYDIAWKSQLMGITPEKIKRSGLNIDARETLFLEGSDD